MVGKKFAVLDALEDGNLVHLCFRSMADAERFKAFAELYIRESGAGNGYGAYWVFFNAEIKKVRKIRPNHRTVLNHSLVQFMARCILDARLADRYHGRQLDVTIGWAERALTFEHETLPPRQIPVVGDMFRDPARDESPCAEGRVMAKVSEGMAEVIDCFSEKPDGSVKPGAVRHVLPINRLMKIHDWMREMRRHRRA